MGDESVGDVCAILAFSVGYKFFIIIKLFIKKKRQETEDKRKRKASKSRQMDEDKE